MTDTQRVRVSRQLYACALDDAIAWTESILETHDPTATTITSCCTPQDRCEDYRTERLRLGAYTRARKALARGAV